MSSRPKIFLLSLAASCVSLIAVSAYNAPIAAAFSASTVNADTANSGTLVLQTNNGSANCVSTGPTVTTNSAECVGGAAPAGPLSSTATATSTVTTTDLGNLNASSASLHSSSCGEQYVADTSGHANQGLVYDGTTLDVTGPMGGKGVSFNGTNGWIKTLKTATSPGNLTIVAWFKTTSTTGGSIIGFSNKQGVGAASDHDRQIWMENTGKLVWGVYNGATYEAISAAGYNNGAWNFVAVSIGPNGQYISVDGTPPVRVANTTGQTYNGWWHLGWADEKYWAHKPTDAYWNGSLGQIAIFNSQIALTSATIANLYQAATPTDYATLVHSHTVSDYWAMTDTGTSPYAGATSSATFVDASGNGNTGTAEGGYTMPATGPLSGNAIKLNGSTGWVKTAKAYTNLQNFTEMGWFNTSVDNGSIIGMTTNQNVTPPTMWDRQIWIDSAGNVVYGVYNGATDEVASSGTNYANGQWNFVVGEVSAAYGLELYVNGVLVGAKHTVHTAQVYDGYWHLGWSNASDGWPDGPTNPYWDGSLAQMAVLAEPLTSTQVSALYAATSVSQYAQLVSDDSPLSYWPLDSTTSSACSNISVTVQAVHSGTTECVYPAATGACPAMSNTYTMATLSSAAFTPPTIGNASDLTIDMRLGASVTATQVGLHILPGLYFDVQTRAFTAQTSYLAGVVEL